METTMTPSIASDTLDPLQQRWAAQDRKLDQALKLNRQLLGALERNEVRGAVGRLFLPVGWDIAMDALLVLMFGLFIGNRLEQWQAELRFLVPAALLFALSVAALASSIRQMVRLQSIDPARPVSEAQRAIEWLRLHRIFVTKAVFLLAPVLWIPLLIVGLRALGGDLYAHMSTPFLVANIVVGVLFVPAVLLIARLFGERVLKYRWVRALHDELGGARVAEAHGRLAEIAAFEREGA
jgi:hypothetical protein